MDIQSRFAHVLEFYVWKEGAQRSLEGLAGLYGMSFLKDLVLEYDFTTEQKAQAVRLSQELGSIAQVARDLDLTESSLANWIRQAKIDEGSGQPGELTTDERVELHRLRRENRILEQERSFLKKAAAYFAKGRK